MLVKMWRGEYPLPVSFWLFYLLGQSVFIFLLRLYNTVLSSSGVSIITAVAAFLLLFMSIFYFVLTIVGVWQATERYKGPWGWSMTARLVTLSEIAVIAYIFGADLGWWTLAPIWPFA